MRFLKTVCKQSLFHLDSKIITKYLDYPESRGNISSLWMSLHPGHMSGIFSVTFIKSYILLFKTESWTTDGIELHSGQRRFQVGQLLCKLCSTLAQCLWRIPSPHSPHFKGWSLARIFRQEQIFYIVCLFCTSSRLTWRGLMLSRQRTFYLISYFPVGKKRKPIKERKIQVIQPKYQELSDLLEPWSAELAFCSYRICDYLL